MVSLGVTAAMSICQAKSMTAMRTVLQGRLQGNRVEVDGQAEEDFENDAGAQLAAHDIAFGADCAGDTWTAESGGPQAHTIPARRTLWTPFGARTAGDGLVRLLEERIDVIERLGAHASALSGGIVERQTVRPSARRHQSNETRQAHRAGRFLRDLVFAYSFSGGLHSVRTSPAELMTKMGVRLIRACSAAWIEPAGWRFLRARISRATFGKSSQNPCDSRVKGGLSMSMVSRMLLRLPTLK
jgi:hypothetical protein